jgi:glycosyltransferase involved in cell wall biosynthesis
MTILHLNDKISISGGVEVYIAQLMEFLPQYHIKSYWLGVEEFGRKYNITAFGEKAPLLSDTNFNAIADYLNKFIIREKVDVIHIHSISNPKLIRFLFTLKPVVRSMHEPRIICPGHGKFWRKTERICNQPFGLHCIYHTYEEGCCNRHPKRLLKAYINVSFETTVGKDNYAAIMAMSEYMVSEALKCGFSEKLLVLNPYFTPEINEKNLYDATHDQIRHLIFVGRLSHTKGVHYFVEAGLALLSKGYNVHLDIVGDGHDVRDFKKMIPKEFKNKFIFHGWQDRECINTLLSQSYLMVFPSIYPEAFGISGIEAMMRAKPVVGFDVGGVSTWLKHNQTGYLVVPKNTTEMVVKIAQLLDNTTTYQNMSQKAREIALNEFSVEKHMKSLIETYKKVLTK